MPADGIWLAVIPYSTSYLKIKSSASLSATVFSGFYKSDQRPLFVNRLITSSVLSSFNSSILITKLAIIICCLKSPLTKHTAISAICPFWGSVSVISISRKHIGLLMKGTLFTVNFEA